MLYNQIKAFDTFTEKLIIEALVTELNKKHGTDLATSLDFTRCADKATMDPDADPAVILVGNSHTNYLATALAAAGYKSVVVEMRPWRQLPTWWPSFSGVWTTLSSTPLRRIVSSPLFVILADIITSTVP
jgi:hypothetical protein